MPELPEVETVRRCLESVLVGHKITEAEFAEDAIVFQKVPPTILSQAVQGQTANAIGRKGKYWWIEFANDTTLFGHLGMAGWVRELGAPTIRLKEHGEMPLDDAEGRPRFMKFILTTDEGRRVTLTDGRRLARAWLGGSPLGDKKIQDLGPDAWTDLPDAKSLHAFLAKRKAPVKALLMDQTWISGIGNWLADEILYQARIAPARAANTLSVEEVSTLRIAMANILDLAVAAGADEQKYPKDWLFHTRWGGGRGAELHEGRELIREQVGGRTTAWVPSIQK